MGKRKNSCRVDKSRNVSDTLRTETVPFRSWLLCTCTRFHLLDGVFESGLKEASEVLYANNVPASGSGWGKGHVSRQGSFGARATVRYYVISTSSNLDTKYRVGILVQIQRTEYTVQSKSVSSHGIA